MPDADQGPPRPPARPTEGDVLTLRVRHAWIRRYGWLLSLVFGASGGTFATWRGVSVEATTDGRTEDVAAGAGRDYQATRAKLEAATDELLATRERQADCVTRKEFIAEQRRVNRALGRRKLTPAPAPAQSPPPPNPALVAPLPPASAAAAAVAPQQE